MEYRAATESDAPLLAGINRQLIEAEWGSEISLDRLEARIRRWLADGEYRAFLFEERGTTVAYALLSIDEDSAYIRHFFVLEGQRRKGTGQRVVQTLLREIIPPHARVTLDVLASNRSGHRFWHSVGFKDYSIRMERLSTSVDESNVDHDVVRSAPQTTPS